LIASLTTEVVALERKRNAAQGDTKIDDGCEIASNGEVVCKNNDNTDVDEEDCVDSHENCSFWAAAGECVANPTYMLEACEKSCNNCPGDVSEGAGANLQSDKEFLLHGIQEFGVAQTVNEDDVELSNIRDSISYMKNFVNAKVPTHRMTNAQISSCRNQNALCSYWAILGECNSNPNGMNEICAPACRSCHTIKISEAQ